jgi:hypothetical protein
MRNKAGGKIMTIKKGLFILLIFTFFILTAGTAQAQSGLLLSGVVINGTAAGSVPDEGQVTVQFYSDTEVGNAYTTDLLPDGSFVFEDLSSEIGNYYVVYMEYLGVVYSSIEAQLLDVDNPPVRVMIYETTDSPENIIITNLYYLVYPGEGGYQLTEVLRIENRGDRTYLGKMTDGVLSTFTWTPPQNAADISFMESSTSNRYTQTGSTYQDTFPIRPVPYYQEVDIAYRMPFAETVSYSNRYEYPVQQVIISGNLEAIEISGDDLRNEEVPENEMGLNTAFSAGPFEAGAEISFNITGKESSLLPTAKKQSGFTFNTTSFLIGAASLAAAVLFGVIYLRQPSYPAPPEAVKPEVKELAQLKKQFEEDESNQQDYQSKKKQLIGKIKRKLGKDFPKVS